MHVRVLVRLLAGLVVAYAALLRLDAVTLTHGPVETPGWIGAIQQTRPEVSAWRPGGMTWPRWEGRYISDPYTYLQYAREPRGFYDAHRREPGFVFATRVALWVFNDQDVAVSWASAFFSVLAVFGTFLLGRRVWSPAAGLLASGALAIEMTVITWAAGGWRDEAFMCAVVFTAHALLRLRTSPTTANATWFGVVAAAACLVRITSLSFVVPALAMAWWLVPAPPRARAQLVGVAGLVLTVLVAPYLINCWRVFGDPLYAINVHADVYREAEGQQVESSQSAREYLVEGLRSRPMETLDTAVLGKTAYPFTNKWDGFAVWHPWLPALLSTAALAGLVGLLGFSAGRVLLGLLAASLVPYAMTWRLISDWRFTAHAYPIFLIAAAVTVLALANAVRPEWWRAVRARGWPARRDLVFWPLVLVALLVATWVVVARLPGAVAQERLRIDRVTTIAAGTRDVSFFRRGWQRPRTLGNVTARVTAGSTATLRLPTAAGAPWDLVVRMDPFPAPRDGEPLPHVRVFLDGQPAGRVPLTWDPQRIGAYVLPMPATRGGWAEVELFVEPEGGGPGRLRLWWAQVRLREAPRLSCAGHAGLWTAVLDATGDGCAAGPRGGQGAHGVARR